jgi:hypothetical protein
MARNGFKIFDSDTHIGPAVDVLEKYLTESERRKLDSWEPYKWVDPRIIIACTGGMIGSFFAASERQSRSRITGASLASADHSSMRSRCPKQRSFPVSASRTWIAKGWT